MAKLLGGTTVYGQLFTSGNIYISGIPVVQNSGAIFVNRPCVNGTGVLLSGEAAALPSGLITSGQTGAFYAASNPSGFITGVDLSSYALKSQTGSFVTTAQTGVFATAINLASTGNTLVGQINTLSGNSVLGNGAITNIVSLTQSQFNGLTPNANTVYLIVG